MKDLYNESYKTLKKEIEEDTRRYKDLPCSWIRRINIMKVGILLNSMCIISEIPTKKPMSFFTEVENQSYNSYGNKRP
jgi:hypothetical protein